MMVNDWVKDIARKIREKKLKERKVGTHQRNSASRLVDIQLA